MNTQVLLSLHNILFWKEGCFVWNECTRMRCCGADSLVRTCVVVAVIVPSSQRYWLAAEQWFTAQIVAELLQEAQHIRHTVHCRQCKSVLLLVKVGCRAIGQRSGVSQQCTIIKYLQKQSERAQ